MQGRGWGWGGKDGGGGKTLRSRYPHPLKLLAAGALHVTVGGRQAWAARVIFSPRETRKIARRDVAWTNETKTWAQWIPSKHKHRACTLIPSSSIPFKNAPMAPTYPSCLRNSASWVPYKSDKNQRWEREKQTATSEQMKLKTSGGDTRVLLVRNISVLSSWLPCIVDNTSWRSLLLHQWFLPDSRTKVHLVTKRTSELFAVRKYKGRDCCREKKRKYLTLDQKFTPNEMVCMVTGFPLMK